MHLVVIFLLFHRGKVPWALGIQGIPEKFDFDDLFWTFFYKKNMRMVDQHGWILEFRAENDTK